jgi:hypothetical protein
MPVLFAGKFSAIPIYAQVMRGGIVGFYDALDTSCWSDPNHRNVVASMDHARALLDAHGFVLGPEIIQPTREGGVATFARFNIYTKGQEPVAPPAPNDVIDELTKLRDAYAALEARCAELDAANARLQAALSAAERRALEWDEHHPAYIQGGKDALRMRGQSKGR